MVAVVSGSGLGLFGTSGSTQGANGNANLGRGGEQVFVNTATGNLVIQGVDETLASRGLDLALVRTYNSQGLLNDDNGDNWRLGVHRRVYGLTGTVNTAGSTVIKVFGDGAEVQYVYDATLGLYVADDGDGAHDTLAFDTTASEWTWTDSSTRVTATYDAQGRLTSTRDPDGNATTYFYTGARLTRIVDASGQETHLDYIGNQLDRVRVVSDGATQTLTRYGYDSLGRLASVTVDLSPEDNDIADDDVYVTSYTYEADSRRVASITQTDGSSISFTYQFINDGYRVHTFTDAENRTTTLEYTLPSATGGTSPTQVNANPGVLIDTEEQTTSVDYTLDEDAVSTTDTQVTTVPHPLNTGALSTTDTQTTTVERPLDVDALTQPAMGWAGPSAVSTPARAVNDPRIGFDAQGNAIAVWRSESNVYAQRFDRATGTWGALNVLDTLTANPSISRVAVDAAGNAVAAWVQSDGTAASLFASRYDAATGTWSAATQLDSRTTAVSATATGLSVAIRGDNAAIAWLQPDAGTVNCVWGVRFSGGAWSTPTLLDTAVAASAQPSVDLDSAGNVTVLWQQSDGTANSVWQSRYDAVAGTWSAAATFETSNTAVNDPQVAFDAAGNGLAIWREAGNIFARRYTAATNTWSAQVALDNRTNTITAPDLAIDQATGNAVATWVQSDGAANSVYVSRFDASAGTWTGPTLIEASAQAVNTTTGNLVVSIAGSHIAVGWLQSDGTRNNFWLARFTGGAWNAPELVETLDSAAAQPSVAVDASGNVTATWQQVATDNTNMFIRRFEAASATWSAPSVHPSPAVAANDPQIAFDAAGNAVAIWRAYNNLYTQSYDRATGQWSALQVLDSANAAVSASHLSVDAAGNAVAAWVQTDGTASSAWAAVRDGATGAWGTATLIETSTLPIATAAGSIVTAINNGHIAVAALVTDGVNHLAVSRLTASGWSEPFEIDDNDDFAAAQPQLSVDAAGDVFVTWRQQRTGINNAIFAARYRADTDAWSTPALVDTTATAANDPRLIVANNGNAVGLWREGGNVQAFYYNFTGDAFQMVAAPIDNRNNTINLVDLAMDRATGNALAAWVQSDGAAVSVYTSFYTAATQTWSTPANIDGSANAVATTAGTLRATMSGSRAAVAWLQTDGTRNNLMVSTFAAGAWSTPGAVESADTAPAQPSIAIDANGIVSVMWQQSDGLHANVMVNHFAPGGGQPYYTVQAGDDWASIAGLLYGDPAGGDALADALGNPVLAAGLQLTGFPATLEVETTVTITVPPYYQVQDGDTWESIASLLYGTSAVAGQLAALPGMPPLVAGNRLTNLPASLSTTTTTTITVPPYYIVQADDTWESIALLLYGTAAVADQLSAHFDDAPLSAGLRLDEPPATLTVTTTVNVPVTPYYLVQDGQDWDDIALAVYGTDDANAVAALSGQFPGVTLAAGLRLEVPASLTYIPAGAAGSTLFLQTDIEDALGFVTTIEQDAAGRLLAMLSPTVNGTRLETRYGYDADGNVTSMVEDPDGVARTTTMEYDARGNLVLSRDHAGNTVRRTWSDTNQLLTETRYLVADPDGAGPELPSVPLTARFVYDAEEHLRFTVSASGRVVEHRYNASGEQVATLQYRGALYNLTGLAPDDALTLAELTTWAGEQDLTRLVRVDIDYDFRGNVETTTTYQATNASGEGVGQATLTRFVYDQHGRLLTRIDPRGEATPGDATDFVTTFTYDGLGRVQNVTEWVSSGIQRQTITDYDDANRRTTVSLYNGLITTTQFNRAGELASVMTGVMGDLSRFGTTTNTYDANGRLRMVTDPNGARSFSLYDEAGRLVATVDPDGSFSELVYDDTNSLVKSIEYAVRLDAATLATLVDAGVPQDVPLQTLRDAADGTPADDRISRTVYDSAGRVIFSIDADGAVTQMFYDAAGRVTEEVAFATRVDIARELDVLQADDVTVTSSARDRHTRHFYDADGNEIATLDSGGYLVEYLRDPAGFMVQQVAYATQTAAQYWTAGTLEELRPAASEDDMRSRFFHDGQGRVVGVLDAEGYLTETVYDEAGNAVETTRYDVVVEFEEGTSTFESLRTDAQQGEAHTMSVAYDGVGRVRSETNFEGTVTRYEYDDAGRITTITRALGSVTDERTTQTRKDEMGRVVQELTAEGYSRITAGMSAAEIAAIWSQYSVTFAYDGAGRRVSSTIRPNDEQTLTTLFFYDEEDRLRFQVNAHGEVSETRYDAFGQVSATIAYTARISTADLQGGAIVPLLTDRVATAADASRDASVSMTYTRRGQLASSTSAENAGITHQYDAFGGNSSSSERLTGDVSLRHEYTYDNRGQLTQTVWDPTGLNVSEQRTYDAFGRVVSVTDARDHVSSFEYDRLGRQIAVVDPLSGRSSVSYDAFSRKLTTTDANGATTSYSYDDAARTMTVLTPEGVEIVTTHNRHGQALRITQAGRSSQSRYDLNGNLLETFDNLGSFGVTEYDRGGRVFRTTSVSGVVNTLEYDAANRVLTSTVDSVDDELQLITQYVYDGQGRVTRVIEPGGRVSDTTYDRDGRVKTLIVDPDGLNLTTEFIYDLAGRQIEMIEGVGSSDLVRPLRTVTQFDALGRRTREIVDPLAGGEGLNLVTEFRYDDAGNLTRKIDAAGNSSWLVYDANSQVRFTVDALGGIGEMIYDAAGFVTASRRYALPARTADTSEMPPFGDVITLEDLAPYLATHADDRLSQTVFDGDGNAVFAVNALGGVTENTFDANGNITRTRLYSTAIPMANYTSLQQVREALELAGNDLDEVADTDRVSFAAYDLRGRTTFVVDGLGAVTRSEYDAAGNVARVTSFATARDTSDPVTDAALRAWAESAAVAGDEANRVTRYWYDSLGRERFVLDAAGFLTETRRDDHARTESSFGYAEAPPAIAAGATLDDVEAIAAGIADVTTDRTTRSESDVAGRITRVYDAAGNYEEYGYDSLGNRTSLRNKLGAVWTYEYDANRRLISETTPEVSVTTVTSVEIDAPDYRLEASTGTESIVTRMEYDALGSVVSRTEGYGRADARTTRYEYDALGRQVRTFLPLAGTYEAEGQQIYNMYGELPPRWWIESSREVYTETIYNALGDAVYNIGADYGETDRYFDRLGRLRYEIDPESGVTEYRYDIFGNQVELIRYANRFEYNLPDGVELTTDTMAQTLQTDPLNDRIINTEYDRLNRAVRVLEHAVLAFEPSIGSGTGQLFTARPTTVTQYDAFGQVVKHSRLVNPLESTWADSYSYFDKRGLMTATVDALGYLTTFEYDAYGNNTRTVQFSHALAAGDWSVEGHADGDPATSADDPEGMDRETRFDYDSLNRLVRETRVGVAYSSASASGIEALVADAVTEYGFDALGNQTRTTDAAGATTYVHFDVLGRQIAIAAPTRDRGDGVLLTPLITMKRDAFGNVVEQRVHSLGTPDPENLPAPVESTDDRVSRMLFDGRNQRIQVQDADGVNKYFSYNARGDVGREWTLHDDWVFLINDPAAVTAYEYDYLGRQVREVKVQSRFFGSGEGFGVDEVGVGTIYNTFGEMTDRYWDAGRAEHYEYDNGGRLVRTNRDDGVTRVYLYDLAGHATAEIRSPTRDLYGFSIDTAAILTQDIMRTETRYDLLGRVVEQRLPDFVPADVNAGLQAIGALLKIEDNVLGPNNPDAVYRVTSEQIDYGDNDLHFNDLFVRAVRFAVGDGGGYMYQAPTTSQPGGGWVQDPNYALEPGRYIHWQAPSGFFYSGSNATIPTFEFRPISSSTYTPLRVVDLPNGRLGVDISDLEPGEYSYRLTFRRANSTEPYAIATGVANIGATLSLQDTTAATLAGNNQVATTVVEEQAVNTQFRDANFRVGDFDAPNPVDPFVYRLLGGRFVVDRIATVAEGGGYYRTTAGYVQKEDYLPSTSRLLQWNAPADPDLGVIAEITETGTNNWVSMSLELRAGGVYSAAIGDLPDGNYDYRITYYSISNPAAGTVASASGALLLEPATGGERVTVSADPPDEGGTIPEIHTRPAGSMSARATIVTSAEAEEYGAEGVLFSGDNEVLVTFPSITGPVRIELGYNTREIPPQEDPGPDGQGWRSSWRQISMYFADASAAAEGLRMLWNDPAVEADGGGISSIQWVDVYSVDAGGNSTLRYSNNPQNLGLDGRTELVWKAPWHEDVRAEFRLRRKGATAWEDLSVARQQGDFVVDVGNLAPGAWEYEIRYIQRFDDSPSSEEILRTVSRGTIHASGSAVLNQVEPPPGGVYPTEAVSAVTGYYTDDVGITVVSSSELEFTGTPWGAALPFTWTGQNQVDLSWADLGTGHVNVHVSYKSQPRYAFNYTEGAGYDPTAAYLPGISTGWSQEFTNGATGVSLSWIDEDYFGGIANVERVEVYAMVNGEWQLRIDHDVNAVRAGRSLYWGVPDDPAVTTEFRVRNVGMTAWQTRTAVNNGSGLMVADLDDLATGNYEYQVLQSRDDGDGSAVVAHSFGTFSVTASRTSHNLGATQYNVTVDGGAQDVGLVTWNGQRLQWTQAPTAGDTVSARMRAQGTETWTPLVAVAGVDGNYTADLTVDPNSVVEFEVLYTRSGETEPYRRAGGRLNERVAVTREAPVLTIRKDFEATEALEFGEVYDVFAVDGQLTWNANVNDLAWPEFRIRPAAGGDWVVLPVTTAYDYEAGEAGYLADLSGLESGDYDYQINYLMDDSDWWMGRASGRVTVVAAANGAGMTLTDTTEYTRTIVSGTNPNVPTRTQVLDRWGNTLAATDATGNTTNYRYNQSDKLVQTLLPQVQVVDTTGGTIDTRLERPVQENHYDILGQLVATRDAKGNVNRAVYNAGGDLVQEVAADGGTKTHRYDVFGDRVLTEDELGFLTSITYDKMSRLTRVEREVEHGGLGSGNPARSLVDSYEYDSAGRRTSETNSLGESVFYRYTLEGNLLERSGVGSYNKYLYDAYGNKIWERDGIGKVQAWKYDDFGRLVTSWDLSSKEIQVPGFASGVADRTNPTSYTYDLAGQLVTQTSALGQRQRFFYDEAGHLVRIVDTGTPSSITADVVGVNRVTEYGYDLEGRRVTERTIIDNRVHQDNVITFDALGRIARVNDPDYEVTYSYDGVGNRTRINANYYNHIGRGAGNVRNQDLWYTYDEMNRVLVSQGMNFSGTISIGTQQGIDLTYNLRGERTSARTSGEHLRLNLVVFGDDIFTSSYQRVESGLFTEYYTYDGVGRLTATDEEVATRTQDLFTGNVTNSTTVIRTASREYDGASRETLSINYGLKEDDDSAPSLRATSTSTTYDGNGRMYQQITSVNGVMTVRMTFGSAQFVEARVETITSSFFKKYKLTFASVRSGTSGRSSNTAYVPRNAFNPGSWESYTTTRYVPDHWEGLGWDDAGNLIGYTMELFKETSGKKFRTSTHRFDYRFGSSYQQIGEHVTSTGKDHPQDGKTTRTYNVNGELVQFTDSSAQKNNRYFANNHEGQALTVINGKFSGTLGQLRQSRAWDNALTRTGNSVKAQYFFFANGQNIGTFGQLVDEDGEQKANFDVNFTPVSSQYPAASTGQIIAQEGDTLRDIAARVFGDASLWYVLAEANGLTDPNEALVAGTAIDVPSKVLALSNQSDSFKPFDASLALGDTTPTQKPPKSSFGLLQILIVVIAIVVAWYLAPIIAGLLPAAWGAMATVVGGAVAGAIGSAVSQGVAIMFGVQDKFDWKQVATSAITAGVAAGMGELAAAAKGATEGFLKAANVVLKSPAARAALSSALTQGISVMTGLQSSFSWREVGIAAIAGAAGDKAGKLVGGGAAAGTVRGFAGSFASNAVSSAVRMQLHGRMDLAQVLTDAFGAAIGDSVTESLTATRATHVAAVEEWRDRRLDRKTVSAEFRPSDPKNVVTMNDIPTDNNPKGSIEVSPGIKGVKREAAAPRVDEVEEIVVTAYRKGNGWSNSVFLKPWLLHKYKLEDVTHRTPGEIEARRRLGYTRTYSHAEDLQTLGRAAGMAHSAALGNTKNQRILEIVQGWLKDSEMREHVLIMSGVSEQDLAGKSLADQLDLIGRGTVSNAKYFFDVMAVDTLTAALGGKPNSQAARFLDLVATNFEGVAELGTDWIAGLGPLASLDVLSGAVRSHLQQDVNAYAYAARIGMADRNVLDDVEKTATDSNNQFTADVISGPLAKGFTKLIGRYTGYEKYVRIAKNMLGASIARASEKLAAFKTAALSKLASWFRRSDALQNLSTQDLVAKLRVSTGTHTDDIANELARRFTANGEANRVVLGKWEGDDAGYVLEGWLSKSTFYDSPKEFYGQLTKGFEDLPGKLKAWSVNAKFLEQQMIRGVGRIDIHGISITEALKDPKSFLSKEIRYLSDNARYFGYVQQGNSWVKKAD